MFKLVDFKCSDCDHVQEVMLDSRDPDQKFVCEECKSENMEKIISVGAGKGGHISWSKWRAQQ